MNDAQGELMMIERQGAVTVVQFLAAALMAPAQIERADEQLQELLRGVDEPKLVIVLDQVEHLSSLMLSVLIRVRSEVGSAGGRVVLAAIPRQLQGLFDLVKVSDVFDTFGTTQEAVAAFSPAEAD